MQGYKEHRVVLPDKVNEKAKKLKKKLKLNNVSELFIYMIKHFDNNGTIQT